MLNSSSENASGFKALHLTNEERVAIAQRASRGLIWTLSAQAVMALIAIAISAYVAGSYAALSAMVGAAAYFLPNAFFAMRLLLGMFGVVNPSAYSFFWGEAFKLGAALAILGSAAWWGKQWLVWPALVFGLFAVLKGYVLLLLIRKLP